ncbi:protein kinase domain-containing protein [Bremerella sp.]|uniref:serine/threonine protein kinase n=1 Tax=Bremerella sp. TaxID=2795602 RepID=UPI00391D72D6
MIPPHDSADDFSDDDEFREQISDCDEDSATRTYLGKLDEPTASEVHIPLLEPGDPAMIGKFRILQRLGKGGMGVVYKAYDEQLQRYVAIKSVTRELASSEIARRRFIREARAVAAIRHTNVITIHAVESQSEIPYLVMELIDGCTLREFRKREEPLTPLRILSIAAQIASGLTAAHVRGVVHRDVKLTNIMIDASDRVVITDFGLARAVIDNANLTSGAMPLGTPAYMSPEQVKGETVDARSDLFSFGCVLYAMYTGYSPFQGLNPLEMARKVTEFKPPSLKDITPNAPEFFSNIVDRLLQKDPGKRYQSSLEVRDLLQRHLRELNQSSTDELDAMLFSGVRAEKKRSTWAWIPALAIPLVLLVAVVGWASGWFASDSTVPVKNSLLDTGQSGDPNATAASVLADRLQNASPGDTIDLPDGIYTETITLENVKQITLRPAGSGAMNFQMVDPEQPMFRLSGCSDITLQRMEAVVEKAPFLSIRGMCENIVLEDLTLSQTAEGEAIGMVQIEEEAQIDGLSVVGSTFDIHGPGQAIWIEPGPVARSISIHDNHFRAVNTHIGIMRSVDGCQISHNEFVGGANAINLSLFEFGSEIAFGEQLEITNNTMVNVRFWLGLHGAIPPRGDFASVVNNLLIDCGRMQGDENSLLQAIDLWHWQSNYWQPDFTVAEDNDGNRIERIDDRVTMEIEPGTIDAKKRDEQSQFSKINNGGAGGGFANYVGAVKPDDEP